MPPPPDRPNHTTYTIDSDILPAWPGPLSCSAHAPYFCWRREFGYGTVAVSWQDFTARKLKCSLLLWHIQSFLKCIFEALNLIFYNFLYYVPEIQLPANVIQLLSITQSSGQSSAMAGHQWFLSHHVKYKCFMPAARVDSSLKLSFSAKNLHMASQFKLAYQSTKNEPPPLSFPKLGKMPIRVAALAFDHCFLCYRSLCTLQFPLPLIIREKRVTAMQCNRIQSWYFWTCMGPRNRFQGMNSASLCSLAGRYNNPIPTRCLAPIDFLKIPAQ
jgi:hypothetical protein